ncbi:MAG: hypothetical protein JSW34_00505 [Candidatus Zixiibacteriota bacterium]|nr:MAG: hypothetical protein JSW34_00505 [candidate division Zixibacteria bacterium]
MCRLFVIPVLVALALLAVAGCGGGVSRKGAVGDENRLDRKIEAEAFLFDAKLKRHGKTHSVRLEFYQTDSLVGISGKGYLGKGALKGWLTADSIKVYFPSTDEYVYEAVADLMGSFDCVGSRPHLNLFQFFANRPEDVAGLGDSTTVFRIGNSVKYPGYEITFAGCPWQIELTYVKQKDGWRIKDFTFSDGDQTSLKAKRRKYRRGAGVKLEKFMAPVRDGSVRIIL